MSDSLEHNPYDYWVDKGETVHISRGGRLAKRLRGKAASRFLLRVENVDAAAQQQLMARATGQYKFGNERAR